MGAVLTSFYQLNRGATAGATTECPVGQVTARRGKEAATRWSKGQERLTALARAIAQSTAVDCLDVKPAQVQQALAPLWDYIFSGDPPTRLCVQWQGGRGGTGQGASGYSEQQLAVPAPVALWARATVRALRRFH